MAAVPVGAHARPKVWTGFDQGYIPAAHQFELVRGGASGETAANDQCFFH
jgi:hypothetical protein